MPCCVSCRSPGQVAASSLSDRSQNAHAPLQYSFAPLLSGRGRSRSLDESLPHHRDGPRIDTNRKETSEVLVQKEKRRNLNEDASQEWDRLTSAPRMFCRPLHGELLCARDA